MDTSTDCPATTPAPDRYVIDPQRPRQHAICRDVTARSTQGRLKDTLILTWQMCSTHLASIQAAHLNPRAPSYLGRGLVGLLELFSASFFGRHSRGLVYTSQIRSGW